MQSTRERLRENRKKRRLRLLRLFFIAAVVLGGIFGVYKWATAPTTAFGSIVIEGTTKLKQDDVLNLPSKRR